jgi:hypothetical protein
MRRALIVLAGLGLIFALVPAAAAAPPGVPKAADLYAAKTTDVGDIYVWNDATKLYVEIDIASGWCMTESHVAVASAQAGIPQTSTGNPIPGQFPKGDTYDPCEDTDTFWFLLSDFDTTPVIAVHAKVVGNVNKVTNGGFEADEVPGTNGWAIFPNPTGWDPDAYSGTPDPGDPQGLEIQEENLFPGGDAQGPDGDQWAELDAYYPLTVIAQDVAACATGKYVLKYAYSARPTVADNRLDVTFGSQTWSHTANGAALTENVWHYVTKSLSGPKTGLVTLKFAEPGPNDQLGMFLDEVRLTCAMESAWAAHPVGQTQFPGANWATSFGYTVQAVLVETVTVPATDPAGATSATALTAGAHYQFRVTGTVTWLNRGGFDVVDAECVNTDGGGWLQGVAGFPDDLLNLQVGTTSVDWTPVGPTNGAGCSDNHLYTRDVTGTGATVGFRIYDGEGNVQNVGWFGDNSGSLTVQIWRIFP